VIQYFCWKSILQNYL